MRCSAPSDGSTSRRSAFTPRTMRPRSTTTRCAMPGTACARQRGSRSTANTTLAFEWMDLAPPGETFWAQIPSSTPRSPGTSERARDPSDTRAEFFAFPTAPSGLCKENIEECRLRAEVRSPRRALSASVGRCPPRQSASGGICRVAHRLLRRLHDRRRYRRLCHRPRHRTRVWRPGQPHRLPCALFSVLVGVLGACGVDDGAQARRTGEYRVGLIAGKESQLRTRSQAQVRRCEAL